ncbi:MULTISPECIES: SDR family oxidoreductase [Bacillus]|uniref:SDR family oxidoreductase n=1 Tax=Bacillus TaxID=1386 RepID=UPI0002E7BB8D|nr:MULTISPECIES: SDR family oxidoreductase [Bacillus cereus group]MBJ7949086.1 SDR family oxidoreductase [Bacillus cereus group sp. N24]MBJ8133243.1 SDR family oxidoreductase [Bacillus cereus group sp. N3]MCH5471027.1 SDR family oxidoreductase [Bacillus toyonensis]MCU5490759.1 SDR family oxidoreductase [Bacillus cereus]PDZ93626.1 NAD(P)-dependent oxidoreductase [Bacillus thuringiensis]
MILVTGATGHVGKEVVKTLMQKNVDFQVATRRKESKGVYFDFETPSSIKPALSGITKLFLLRPPHLADAKKYFQPVIDTAKEVGINHIVFLSLLGVEKNPIVPHSKIEKIIKDSGVPYTFLRPSFFMQNLLSQHGDELRNEKIIEVPAGNGKTSFIDVRDIGEVTAKVLIEDGHKFKAYDLTGSEALTYYEVAETISKETKESIIYTNPSIFKFRKRMMQKGLKNDFIMVMIGIYTTARLGLAKKVTLDLEQLLQRKPTNLKQFVHDYRDQII